MSKHSKNNKTEDFQTGYTKAEWYGQSRKQRTKKRGSKKNLYKKNQPDSNAINERDSLHQSDKINTWRPLSERLDGSIDDNRENKPH